MPLVEAGVAMGSPRGRGRVGMAFAGAVLSLVVSAHDGDDSGAAGPVVAGRIAVEVLLTESMGSFRNIARLLFLMVAENSSPAGDGE